jgi:hypothetical protein
LGPDLYYVPFPLDCDDGNACTIDSCDPDVGCVHEPDDGSCDDGIDCSTDICDITSGCINTLVEPSCGDGDGCDVNYAWSGDADSGSMVIEWDFDWPEVITEETVVDACEMNSCTSTGDWVCTSLTFYPTSPEFPMNPEATNLVITLKDGENTYSATYYYDGLSFTASGSYDSMSGPGDSTLETLIFP